MSRPQILNFVHKVRSSYTIPACFGVLMPLTRTLRTEIDCIANSRMLAHEGRRKPSEDNGSQGNQYREWAGAAGEVATYRYLPAHGINPIGYTLFNERTPVGPDCCIGSHRFHIKTIPNGQSWLNINERQRLDPAHAADYYLPVRFLNADLLVLYSPIPCIAVASWEYVGNVPAPYHRMPVKVLRPLPAALDLLTPGSSDWRQAK